MVFSSVIFLFGFLPVVLGLYLVCPRRARNALLLAASLVFYAWGEGFYVALMLVSIGMNWAFGRWLHAARGARRAGFALALAVAGNLSLLAFFKYANFLVANVNELLWGRPDLPIELAPVHLPIGISFFTFQALSYVIDVHRGIVPVERSLLRVGLYVSLFPQLIAGPIVRFRDIARELVERRTRLADFAEGARRFTIGLAKKVLVANVVGRVADGLFAIPNEHLTPSLAWLAVLAYTLQIYFDFSGYSDMAIGLGRILGFRFPENFRYPYVSRSLTEFWRRWHISLSTWFRDYLYVPLGGNRKGTARTYANLVVVFFLCGLWHGAAWNFVLWGLYHGLFLVAERLGRGRGRRAALPWVGLRHAYALLVVSVGWVLFRAGTPDQIAALLKALVGVAEGDGRHYFAAMYLDPVVLCALAAGVVFSAPVLPWLRDRWQALAERAGGGAGRGLTVLGDAVQVAGLGVLLLAAAMQLATAAHNPFIYFRF